jgi:hypothetical protein
MTPMSGHRRHRLSPLGYVGIVVVAVGGGLAEAAQVAWLWAVAAAIVLVGVALVFAGRRLA